ncbi:MAG TPA: hypothetical protein VKV57_04225 [bacterium]|nr:hypothetical protein [bacterium]
MDMNKNPLTKKPTFMYMGPNAITEGVLIDIRALGCITPDGKPVAYVSRAVWDAFTSVAQPPLQPDTDVAVLRDVVKSLARTGNFDGEMYIDEYSGHELWLMPNGDGQGGVVFTLLEPEDY